MPRRREEIARGPVAPWLPQVFALHVQRHAEHNGAAVLLRHVEGFAQLLGGVFLGAQTDVARLAGLRESPLIEELRIMPVAERDFAGDDDERSAMTRRRDDRGRRMR